MVVRLSRIAKSAAFCCLAVVSVLAVTGSALGSVPNLRRIQLPETGGLPTALAPGPDGNMWVGEATQAAVARVTPTGAVRVFRIPGVTGAPSVPALVAGPDGRMWLLVVGDPTSYLVAMTIHGQIVKRLQLPATSDPSDLIVGTDGALWLSLDIDEIPSIARVSIAGQLQLVQLNEALPAGGLAPGSGTAVLAEVAVDGGPSASGCPAPPAELITLDTRLRVRRSRSVASECPAGGPANVDRDARGNIWVGAYRAVVRIDPHGRSTTFGISTPASIPPPARQPAPLILPPSAVSVAAGADGREWFLDWGQIEDTAFGGQVNIGQINAAGVVTEQSLGNPPGWIPPSTYAGPRSTEIAAGSNNTMWISEQDSRTLAIIAVDAVPKIGTVSVARRATLAKRDITFSVTCHEAPGQFCTGASSLLDRAGRTLSTADDRFTVEGGRSLLVTQRLDRPARTRVVTVRIRFNTTGSTPIRTYQRDAVLTG